MSWHGFATGAAILLAIGFPPWGPYDRSVAVLTATFVAVIWYTYLTYRAVDREESSWVAFDLLPRKGTLYFEISNSAVRRVAVTPEIDVWVDGARAEVPPIHGRQPGEAIRLGPKERFSGMLNLGRYFPRMHPPDDEGGVRYDPPRQALIRARMRWSDELGETDATDRKHWEAWVGPECSPQLIIAPSGIRRLFGSLADT